MIAFSDTIDISPVIEVHMETGDSDFWKSLSHPDYPEGVDVHFFEYDDEPGTFGVEVYPNFETMDGFISTDTSIALMSSCVDAFAPRI